MNKIRDNCRNFLKEFEDLIICEAPVHCLVHAHHLINVIYCLFFMKRDLKHMFIRNLIWFTSNFVIQELSFKFYMGSNTRDTKILSDKFPQEAWRSLDHLPLILHASHSSIATRRSRKEIYPTRCCLSISSSCQHCFQNVETPTLQ